MKRFATHVLILACLTCQNTNAQQFRLEAEEARYEQISRSPIPESDLVQGYVQLKGAESFISFPDVHLDPREKTVAFIRYSFWNSSERKGSLCMNGDCMDLVFKGTGSWTRYAYLPLLLPPVPAETCHLKIISGEKVFPRIDHIDLLPVRNKPLYILSSDSLEFLPVKESIKQVEVRCNGTWKILETPQWIIPDQTSGEYVGPLVLKTRYNSKPGLERAGTILVQFNHDKIAAIHVTQPAHQPQVYYLDSDSGNDAFPGLHPDSAWKSLHMIHSLNLGPGDSVLFMNGGKWIGPFSPSGAGCADSCIVFSNYGDPEKDKPLIHAGGGDQAVMLSNMEHVVFENFRITNPADLPERRARGIYIFADQPKAFRNITIRGNEIYQVIGWVKQSRRFSSGAIFTDTQGETSRFENLVFENNWIHDCTTRGITGNAGASNWTDTAHMHNHVLIKNNLIDNMGCDGIRPIASRNVTVENNRVFRVGNYTKGVDPLYIAACFPQQCGSTLWQYNEIAYTAPTHPSAGDMDSQAFDIDHDCSGSHLFQYNYSHDNSGGFFLLMGRSIQGEGLAPFECALIRYNISLNDGGTFPRIFELHDFKDINLDVHAYNNLFYFTGISEIIQAKGDYFTGIRFTNNIFHGESGIFPPDIELLNNLYFPGVLPAHDPSGLNVDPKFIDPGAIPEGIDQLDGYKIKNGSPAGNAGIPIEYNGGRDFWGNAVPDESSVSIGPHQNSNDTGINPESQDHQQFSLQVDKSSEGEHFRITYMLSKPTPVTIRVFNISGEVIDTLHVGLSSPGSYTVKWDPVHVNGTQLGSGYFLCSMQTWTGCETTPFIIFRR